MQIWVKQTSFSVIISIRFKRRNCTCVQKIKYFLFDHNSFSFLKTVLISFRFGSELLFLPSGNCNNTLILVQLEEKSISGLLVWPSGSETDSLYYDPLDSFDVHL